MAVPLSSSLQALSSLTSNDMSSSTPGVVSTASSGTESIDATSSTVETAPSSSSDAQSSLPSSTPAEGTTSTAPTSSFTLASFVSSAGTSDSVTMTNLLSTSSESWSPAEVSTSEMSTSTNTIEIPKTVYTTVSPLTSAAYTPETSTYTTVSILPGGSGTVTFTVTTSGVLSTAAGADAIGSDTSPGKIAAIVLGLVGAAVIVVLWIFCARKRHRKRERDAALLGSSRHPGPLIGEMFDDNEEPDYVRQSSNTCGPPVMEERYADILAALHTGHGAGASTDGVYGSRRRETGASDADIAHASFPSLPSNDDALHITSLSPPPAAILSPRPPTSPPSAYVNPMIEPRRKSSPGPDAAAWLGGYIAPSCASHYANSQALGSGSGSCSVDALTRTHTGSEEPLLSAGILSHAQPPGGNRLGLGSAFGSPEGSVYSPSYGYDARSRTLSGSGSYAHTRSMASSSFDMLRSMSSQGALSGSHADHRFGSGGARSASSYSTGRKKHRHGFGSPPSSFRAWKERGSSVRSKGQSKDRRRSTESSDASASASGSGDERKGRSSPARGVRGLLDRLRRVGHTPSPMSSSRALPVTPTKGSKDFDVERTAGTASSEVRPPMREPIQSPIPTSPRSYVVLNPSPRLGTDAGSASVPQLGDNNDILLYDPHDPLSAPTLPYASMPSPAPTEASRLPAGLLHPRLEVEGQSVTSLRDFEDYSRPIGGRVSHRVHSTTTFGTADYSESTPVHKAPDELPGEPTDSGPRGSWIVDESPQSRSCTTTSPP